jgi:hypothetical protein
MMFKFINLRIFFAWVLSVVVVYFVIGFLGNYYTAFVEIVFLTLLAQSVIGLLIYRLLGKAQHLLSSNPVDLILALAMLIVLLVFAVKMFTMAAQFPQMFNAKYVLLEKDQIIPLIIGCALAFPCLVLARKYVNQNDIKQTRLYLFMNEVVTGGLVASFFFAVYFIFASIFNQPIFDVDDIFFDTDGWNWRTRLTTAASQDYYWRSVHPFVLLILKPVVAFVSFFLKGDRLAAAFLLVALSGALCVFLTWVFVKQVTGNSLYAILIASLLGGSAAHLVFGSLLETYIFIAAVTMLFIVLLLKDTPLVVFIIGGLLTFGITLSSIIQPTIAFVFVRRDVRQWLKYGLIIAALVVPLSLLNNIVYPNSQPYFFDPSSYGTEGRSTFTPSVGRTLAVARVMFFKSIVAPDPLILKREIPFLKVWIVEVNRKLYPPREANPMLESKYETPFGTALAYAWLLLELFGAFCFLKNIKKQDNRFSYVFILIILFSFVFHLKFGKELFLYATNWVYAIVLFLALAWKEFANKRWFQVTLLVFVTLLLVNNSRLIFTMLSTSALHIK